MQSYPQGWVYETPAMGERDSSGPGTRWALLAFMAAALLGGCAGDSGDAPKSGAEEPNIVQAGAPGEPSISLSEDEVAEVEATPHTRADVNFMQGMIHHHAQALLMTGLVPERSASDKIPLLARRTEISQQAEIDTMERWLRARGEKVPDAEDHRRGHGPGADLMPGMVSAHKLARLAASDGRPFDSLFLPYMIRHHQGALTMVRELYDADGGNEPEIGAFARHVDSDQNIEISRMRDLRKSEPGLSTSPGPALSQAEIERARRRALPGGASALCYVG